MAKYLWIMIVVGLLGATRVQAASPPGGTVSIKGAVPLSVKYGSIVRRHSSAELPTKLIAGGQLHLTGRVLGLAGRPLTGQVVGLMVGQANKTAWADSAVTDEAGDYEFAMTLEPIWRGQFWLRLALMTYGRPLLLTPDATFMVEDGAEVGSPRSVTVHLETVVTSDLSPAFATPNLEGFRATINPNPNGLNDVERRYQSSVATPPARGRDSPVPGRSFGDAARGPADTGGGRHQQADQLSG